MMRSVFALSLLVWFAEFSCVSAGEPRLDLSGDPLPPGAIARLGSARLRHGGFVNSLAFTPDGKGLLAGAQDGSLVLWDPVTGKERVCLRNGGRSVTAVAVSPDGQRLVSRDSDGQVIVWDEKGRRLDSWQVGESSYVKSLLFLPDGRSLLIVGTSMECRDVFTGRFRRLVADPPLNVQSAAVAPDGRTLALAHSEALHLYDLPSGRQRAMATFQIEEQTFQMAFSPDSQQLFCRNYSGRVQVRDTQTGKPVRILEPRDVCPLLALAPDRQRLILNPEWKEGRLDGRPLFLYRKEEGLDDTAQAALSPDGRTLAVAEHDHCIRLWDLRTGRERLPSSRLRGMSGLTWPRVELSPDGRMVALLDGDGVLTVGETATGRPLWQAPSEGGIDCLTLSADGRQLVTAESDPERGNRICFRDSTSGKVLRSLPSLPDPLAFLALSPDGRWLLGCASDARQVYLWQVGGQRCLRIKGGPGAIIAAGVFSGNGQSFLTADWDGKFHVWDVATGHERKRWRGHGGHAVPGLSLSADGRVLASAGTDGTVCLWDPETGQRLQRIDLGFVPASVVLSPDAQWVAAPTLSRTLTVWDRKTGRTLRVAGHRGHVTDARFTADGRLVTAAEDGIALVWDLKAIPRPAAPAPVPHLDRQSQPLPAGALARVGSLAFQHPDPKASVAFSPDGRLLAVAGERDHEASVELWDPVKGQLLRVLPLHDSLTPDALAFSPKGKVLVVAAGWTLHCFDPATGECQTRISTRLPAASLAFSPDGRLLALGGKRSKANSQVPILLWDLREERQVGRLEGHPTSVAALAFSAAGRLLHAYCPRERRLELKSSCSRHVWDVVQRKQLAQVPYEDSEAVVPPGFAFSPDGRFLARRTRDQQLEISDLSTERKLFAGKPEPASLAFSRDGRLLAVTRTSGAIELWDPSRGERQRTLSDPAVPLQRILSFSADGRWLLTRDEDSDHDFRRMGDVAPIRLWDVAAGKQHRPLAGPSGAVEALVWRRDGKLVLLEQSGSVARLTDESGQELLRLPARTSQVESLALSPDGQAAAILDRAGRVETWDLRPSAGKPRWTVPGKLDPMDQQRIPCGEVQFTLDGTCVLALTSAGEVHAWSRTTGQPLSCARLAKGEIARSLSPDGHFLATAQRVRGVPGIDWQFRVVSSWTGKEQTRFDLDSDGSFTSIVFSTDGRLLALGNVGFLEGRIRLFEIATGQLVETLALPEDQRLAFSPDGRWLAAGNRVYDLALGRELGVLPGHSGRILTLSFSPDGRRLATASSDQTVLVWDAAWPTLPRPRLPAPAQLNPDALWQDLAQPEAERAWRAVWRLALAPEQSLPLLRRNLKPAETPDPGRLACLLRGLEDDAFAKRDAARKEILRIGEGAVPALRQRLRDTPSADLKRLVEGLREEIEPRPNATQCLLAGRAIAVLERIGSAEARQLLRRLADGAEGHSRTEMARAALERLQRRLIKPAESQSR